MDDYNMCSVCKYNDFNKSVTGRARFLWNKMPRRPKRDCILQAIRELKADKYIEDTARIFDILIEDVREDFINNIKI